MQEKEKIKKTNKKGTQSKPDTEPHRTKRQQAVSILGWITGFTIYAKAFGLFGRLIKSQFVWLKMYNSLMDEEIRTKRIPDDTWAKTVKRHKLTKKKLRLIRSRFLLTKRLLYFSFILGFLSLTAGVWFTTLSTIFMSLLGLFIITLHMVRSSFRAWQIDRKELASIGIFFNEGGWIRVFHWHNRRTISPTTINAMAFMTVAIGWCATITTAMAETKSVGYYIDLARNDMSMDMLGQLFGSIGGLWFGKTTPLTSIFLGYNVAVMSVGMFFLLYTASSGFIQTSQEGEIFGKRYSTIWLPIRLTVGTMGILPMFGGWSGAQAVMFFATALGIGFANAGWQVAVPAMVGFTGTTKTQGSYTTSASNITPAQDVMKYLMQSQLCVVGYNDASGHYSDRENGTKVASPIREKLNELGQPSQEFYSKTLPDNVLLFGGPGGDVPTRLCGQVVFRIPPVMRDTSELTDKSDSSHSGVVMAHMKATQEASKALLPYTTEFFFKSTPITQEVIEKIGSDYEQSVIKQFTDTATKTGKSDFTTYMKNEGKSWITAGAVFFKIAQINRTIKVATNVSPDYLPPEAPNSVATWLGSRFAIDTFATEYPGIVKGSKRFEGLAKETMLDGENIDHPEADGGSLFSKAINKILPAGATAEIIGLFGDRNTGFMFKIIHIGTTIFYIGVGAVAVILSAGTMAGMFGTGIIMFGLTMIVIPLFYIGVTMMVFIPMVPAILWVGGVVTYFVIVVEAFVASPLWMLTHFHGEGDGMGSKSAHGYMFLLQLCFRPILMIIGFVSAWLLLDILGNFMLYTFIVFMKSFTTFSINVLGQFFQFIGVMVAIAIVGNALVQKLFGMVTFLPDQVIAWVGGHSPNFGNAGDSDVKGAIVAVGRHVQHNAPSSPKGGGNEKAPSGGDPTGLKGQSDQKSDL